MRTLSLDHPDPVASPGGDSWSIRIEPLPLSSSEDQLGSAGYTMWRHRDDGTMIPWLWVHPCAQSMRCVVDRCSCPALTGDVKMLNLHARSACRG